MRKRRGFFSRIPIRRPRAALQRSFDLRERARLLAVLVKRARSLDTLGLDKPLERRDVVDERRLIDHAGLGTIARLVEGEHTEIGLGRLHQKRVEWPARSDGIRPATAVAPALFERELFEAVRVRDR